MNQDFCCILGQTALPWDSEDDPRALRLRRWLTEQINFIFHTQGVTRFCVPITRGAGLYAAEALAEYRKTLPLFLEFVIPYEEMTNHWSSGDRSRFFSVMENCDRERFFQPRYDNGCYLACEWELAARSRYLIAVWDGHRNRRIWRTLCHALSQHKTLLCAHPETLTDPLSH